MNKLYQSFLLVFILIITQITISESKTFNFELFKLLEEVHGENNIFFSPLSLQLALQMTYEGAKGQTAEEFENALYFEKDLEKRTKSLENLLKNFNQNSETFKISTVNSIFPQQGYTLNEEYIDILKQYYNTEIQELNYGETQKATEFINKYVENATYDKIKNLIPGGALTPATKLVLVNALYFLAEWQSQFKESQTKDDKFYISKDEQADIKMMNKKNSYYDYLSTDDFEIIKLPYSIIDASMVIILPKSDKNLTKIINNLNQKSYTELCDKLDYSNINLALPKFKITFEDEFKDLLKYQGLKSAFEENANFSGIVKDDQLFISKILQKTFIDVNEQGTEAAAATAVIMTKNSIQIDKAKDVRIDRPFIFALEINKEIAFLGKIINPSEQQVKKLNLTSFIDTKKNSGIKNNLKSLVASRTCSSFAQIKIFALFFSAMLYFFIY